MIDTLLKLSTFLTKSVINKESEFISDMIKESSSESFDESF